MLLAALPAKAWAAAAKMHGLCQSVFGLTGADKSKKSQQAKQEGSLGSWLRSFVWWLGSLAIIISWRACLGAWHSMVLKAYLKQALLFVGCCMDMALHGCFPMQLHGVCPQVSSPPINCQGCHAVRNCARSLSCAEQAVVSWSHQLLSGSQHAAWQSRWAETLPAPWRHAFHQCWPELACVGSCQCSRDPSHIQRRSPACVWTLRGNLPCESCQADIAKIEHAINRNTETGVVLQSSWALQLCHSAGMLRVQCLIRWPVNDNRLLKAAVL